MAQRFKSHKAGRRAARVIKKALHADLGHKLTLRWDLIKAVGNPFPTRTEAEARERLFAEELRARGHVVIQA